MMKKTRGTMAVLKGGLLAAFMASASLPAVADTLSHPDTASRFVTINKGAGIQFLWSDSRINLEQKTITEERVVYDGATDLTCRWVTQRHNQSSGRVVTDVYSKCVSDEIPENWQGKKQPIPEAVNRVERFHNPGSPRILEAVNISEGFIYHSTLFRLWDLEQGSVCVKISEGRKADDIYTSHIERDAGCHTVETRAGENSYFDRLMDALGITGPI